MIVTPGIRMHEQQIESDDQQRILTPYEAIVAGSDYLVMGRSLTQASEPHIILEQVANLSDA